MEMVTVGVKTTTKIYLVTYTFINVPKEKSELWNDASQYIERTFKNTKIDNTTYLISNKFSKISNKILYNKIHKEFNKILELYKLKDIVKFNLGVFDGYNFSHVNLSKVEKWIKNNI